MSEEAPTAIGEQPGWSRRRLLGTGIGAGALAGAVAGGVGVALATDDGSPAASSAQPFWAHDNDGHQAGIATPAQDRLHFASFDI
ncbi:MAG: deferrochelatase/peroxidase EfeB, partial [Mycobacteriales bacterium]